MSGILNEGTNTQQYTPAAMINGPYTVMRPPPNSPSPSFMAKLIRKYSSTMHHYDGNIEQK